MRRYLFEKAKSLNNKGVKITGETQHAIMLEVPSSKEEPHSVVIQYKNREIDITCSCMAQRWDKWCSHKLAAIAHLVGSMEKKK